MRMHNLLRMFTLTGIGLLISISNSANAQFPTFDVAAVKEGISSNIELVKQSKIVTDATATAGKINAGIGDAKASMSKYVGDNLAKIQAQKEKIEKEKKRLEEKKKKYDKYKKQIEKKKKEIEEAKARIERAKAKAEGYKNKAKGYIDDAKEIRDEAKGYINDAKEIRDEVKGFASDVKSTASSKVSNVKSQVGVDEPKPVQTKTVSVPNSDSKNYDDAYAETSPQEIVTKAIPEIVTPVDVVDAEEGAPLSGKALALQEEQDGLDHEMAELEVDAMLAKTPEEKEAIEAKKKELQTTIDAFEAQTPKMSKENVPVVAKDSKEAVVEAAKLEGAIVGRRPFGTKEVKSEPKANPEPKSEDEKADAEPQAFHRAKILDGDTSTKMAIPESHRPKILDEYAKQQQEKKKAPAVNGFRKRALPNKSSSLEGSERKFVRNFEEVLVFAQLGMDNMPDGMQDGVFIISDRMAVECEVSVKDLEDEKVMDECIKKLVALKSDADASIAQEGTAIYRAIMQETVNALVAESMGQKNVAAMYEEKVLKKMEKDIANSKNTRDDTSGLAMTNKELQFLLNRILTVYSAQLSLNALREIGGFESSYYSEDGTTDTESDKDSGEK